MFANLLRLIRWLRSNRGNTIIVRDEVDMNGLPSLVFASKTIMVPGCELYDPFVAINGRLYARMQSGPAVMAQYIYVGDDTVENRATVLQSFRRNESEML